MKIVRVLFGFVLLITACPGQEQKRPNILILLADNWAWPHASAAGDPVVKTPNFDRVAAEGILFSNTYCQVPSCSPARAVLLTGQACHRLRDAANLWGSWPGSLWTYPELLEDAGYAAGYEGKGWGPGVVFQKSGARRNRNPSGRKFASFASFLDAIPEDQPFVYWMGSHNPHQPWTAKEEFYGGLDQSKIKVPAYLPDTPEIRSAILDYYAEVQQFDHEAGLLLEELTKRDLERNTLVIILGDNGWQTPRGLANVYDAGTRTPMAIRWPGKVSKGAHRDQFVSFEDIAPTLLEAAGLQKHKAMTGRSLMPLFKNESVPDWRDAIFLERERHANVRDGDQTYPCRAIRTERYLYVWNLEPDQWPAGDPELHFAVGPFGDVDNTKFKSFILENRVDPKIAPFFDLGFGKRPEHELYDLATDPDQVRNVAQDPANQETVKALQEKVKEWMKETGDPRFKDPRNDVFTNYRYFGGPPKKRRTPKD